MQQSRGRGSEWFMNSGKCAGKYTWNALLQHVGAAHPSAPSGSAGDSERLESARSRLAGGSGGKSSAVKLCASTRHTQRSNKLRRRKSWSLLRRLKPCEKAGGARGWESGSGKGMRRLETRISRCMKPPGPPRSTRLLRTPFAPPRTSTRRAQRSNRESVTHLYPGLSAVSHSNAATGCCCRTRFRACLVAGAWAWPRGRFCAAG